MGQYVSCGDLLIMLELGSGRLLSETWFFVFGPVITQPLFLCLVVPKDFGLVALRGGMLRALKDLRGGLLRFLLCRLKCIAAGSSQGEKRNRLVHPGFVC